MNKTISILATGALMFALGACNSDSAAPSDQPAQQPAQSAQQPAQAGDDKLAILEPASGAKVTAPFTLKVKTADPLGTTATGYHHIHVWFDDNSTKYQLSYADTLQVKDVPEGVHKMTVSLRNANHSDAGPRVDIPITIGGSGGTTQSGESRVPGY